MTRLIDADSIPWLVEGVGDIPVITKEEIDDMPTVDAVPVRHGKWIRTGRTNVYGGYELECSVCGDKVMVQNIEYELYCRNCGALMKGEGDE